MDLALKNLQRFICPKNLIKPTNLILHNILFLIIQLAIFMENIVINECGHFKKFKKY